MTVSNIINMLISKSKDVFGVDMEKFSAKPVYNQEANNIRSLYRMYVRETDGNYHLPLEKIINYNREFNFNVLSLKNYVDPDNCLLKYEESFGIYIDCLGISLEDYIMKKLAYFDFESSDFPELENYFIVLSLIINYFQTYGLLYQSSLFGYIALVAENKLPYEEDCFRNFFLIDVSESPIYIEAVKHFDLAISGNNIRFIFKDYNETLDVVFSKLINKLAFKEYIFNLFKSDETDKVNNEIQAFLSFL